MALGKFAGVGLKVWSHQAGCAGPMSMANNPAIRSRIWRRSMIMSMFPCCSRNSLRWNPSGSVCRTVCSITRGPANPISAFGSAMMMSPNDAKLAAGTVGIVERAVDLVLNIA